MTKQEALEYFGNGTALGDALGITKSAVSQWDVIPIDKQCQLEVLTAGVLKADRAKLEKLAEERTA